MSTKQIHARLEEREIDGTGWYIYVDGVDCGGPFETEADAVSHWMDTTMTNQKQIEVHRLRHNGACWEWISGSAVWMDLPEGSTAAQAILRSGPGGDWPDDDDERVGFAVRDEDGEDVLDTDGDWRFVFSAGELRRGKEDA